MANLRVIYKKRTAGFGNVEERRIIRAVEGIQSRKNRRSADYASNRKIAESITPSSSASNTVGAKKINEGQQDVQESKTEDRRTKLMKWKAEKELQKKIAMQKKLPAFRTGVIHHKLNSPKFLHQAVSAPKPPKPATPRITRATAKRIAAKKISTKTKIIENSFAPQNHQFKAPAGLPVLPLFGPEALDETKTEPGTIPAYFSPYVVSARGKKASRQEQLQNIELGEYICTKIQTKETSAQSTATSDHETQLSTSYFRRITEKEVIRLRALCQHWMEVKTDDSIPEDAQLVINQAIGQTNLLINKKIEQFKQLIVDCDTGSGDQLVTCQDLQGFWEMMYMQVENCDSRFSKLVQLQRRNWQEEEPTFVKKVIPVKKPPANKKVVPSKSSSVRDMIRAARKKQMELQRDVTENLPATIIGETSNVAPGESSRLSAIKFDGGFFVVESPKKSVTPKSIRKSTLSQQPALSDEARRRRSALNLIRLSQILKPPEMKPVTVETDPTILYVNSQQTPCKSILKRTDAHETASGIKKSQNKVIFSNNQKIPKNDKSWLGELRTMMSDVEEKDPERQTELNVKKRLDLTDSDSDVAEAEGQLETKCETSFDQQVNLVDRKVSNHHRNEEDKTSWNSEADETKQDGSSALSPLRGDSVNSTRSVRRTRQGVLNERNAKLVSEFNELDTCHTKGNLTKTNSDQKENEKPDSPEITKRRRSTRKSVRFTGEECPACSDVKIVHPMTPRVKRRTSKLLEMQNADESSTENIKVQTPSTQGSQDLISWDTPKDPPPRVRRSLRLRNVKP